MASEDDSSEPTDLSAFADSGATGDDVAETDGDDNSDNSDSTDTDSTAATESAEDDIAPEIAPTDADRPRAETVALGVELLAHLEDDELDLPEAMDR
ncbi:MAG: hypothetical protein ABEI99_07130, partial [Halobaculum sp.]